MCMCEYDKNHEGDEDMLKSLQKQNEKQSIPKNLHLTNKIAKKLSKEKTTIVCEDGAAKIDPSHPDYRFWMED